ncbi:beta-ketoacyl reductase, partial [Streptomyces sp. NPDC059142]|uniref:beta-ketoacyl reductase n=1 Tax=Streptomyces sp. NPDC059142 TaxID=3346739 RepID=UPI00369B2066
ERLRGVLAAKVAGAWNLHEVAGSEVGLFVLFSSAAGVLGGAGQANYAAGNAFLDALAAYRRARGLSGVSVAWGLWGERSGMTGGLGEGDLARMGRMGVVPMSSAQGLELFDRAVVSSESLLLAARLDFGSAGASDASAHPMFRALIRQPTTPRRRTVASERNGGRPDGVPLSQRLAGLGRNERQQALLRVVREHTAIVLSYESAAAVPADRGFQDIGIDSLTAVELRNRLKNATGLILPATLIFDYPDALRLAEHLAEELSANPADDEEAGPDTGPGRPDTTAPAPARGTGTDDVADQLESAAADELFDFIDREFGSG